MYKKLLALIISIYMAAGPAFAQLTPDGSTNTTFGNSENNTPTINIATPNQNGVSHNKYADYNVGQDNLILNNSRDLNTISKLGGYVGANPNLKNSAEAKIILNEITTNRVSNLNGYTEVAGKGAELIIANPNGINVAGAGFINTPRVSLITGKPNMDAAGNLANFNLSRQGVVNIQGTLDAQGADLYLSGRSIASDGDIFANSINIALGNDTFDYVTKQASSIAGVEDAPEYALDASALGGMYAGLISIIGTEEGIGVRAKSGLVADLGGINITNAGAVEMGTAIATGDINITADTLSTAAPQSEDDVILSYKDININVNTLNNEGDIAAFNDININLTAALNNGGILQANNNLNISGGDIYNNAAALLFANNKVNINTDGAINNYLGSIYGMNEVNITGLSNARATEFINHGLIESRNGDITINADNVSNLSIESCDPATEVCYTTQRKTVLDIFDHDGTYWYWTYVGTAYLYNEYIPDGFDALSRGQILAAKNINIDTDTLTNKSSIINAGEEINIKAVNIHNIRPSEEITDQAVGYLFRCEFFEGYKGYLVDCGFDIEGILGFGPTYRIDNQDEYIRAVMSYMAENRDTLWRPDVNAAKWIEEYNVLLSSAAPAVISAPTVNINAQNTVYNDNYTEETADIAWATNPPGLITQPDNNSNLTFNGLFKQAAPESEYLFASTSRFVNTDSYVGFDYFYGLTGDTHDSHTTKLLGDPVYEQKVIEDAVLRLTGSRFIFDDVSDMNSQMARLYDNAFTAYNDMGLTIGQPLTAEQIKALPDNIIWYVEQEINGQKVLVPTLYIAEHNQGAFMDSLASTIKGGSVNITAGDIYNSGQIDGGVVHLYASGNIKNLSGAISATDALSLDAGGSIINETKKNSVGEHGKGLQFEYLGDTAAITSGGTLDMKAGEDITMKAGYVSSGGDMSMDAGGDINILSHDLTKGMWREDFNSWGIENVGSQIESHGDINMKSGGDITLQASAVRTAGFDEDGNVIWLGGDINMEAQNINVLSAVDESHYWSYSETKKSFGRKKIDEVRRDKTWHVGSDITAGGNLNLTSRNDITVLASSLNTINGDMLLDAANNINILAGVNTEATLDRHEKTGLLGLSGSKDLVYDQINTLEAASAFSGNNITFKSGNDTNVFASDVGAANDIITDIGGNLNMAAGKESHYHYEYHRDYSLGVDELVKDIARSAISFGISNVYDAYQDYKKKEGAYEALKNGRIEMGSLSFNYDQSEYESYKENIRQSTFTAGGSLRGNIENNANILSSNIKVGGLDLNAGKVNLMDMQAESWEKSTETHGKLEVSTGLNIPFFDLFSSGKATAQSGEKINDNTKSGEGESQYKYINMVVDGITAVNNYGRFLNSVDGFNNTIYNKDGAVKNPSDIAKAINVLYVRAEGDLSHSSYNSYASQSVGSVIHATGNVNLNSGSTITQQGSAVVSDFGDVIYKAPEGVEFLSGKSYYANGNDSASVHVAGQFNFNPFVMWNWDMSLEMSAQLASTDNYQMINSNSIVDAGLGTVRINTDETLVLGGANIYGEEVKIKAKDLDLISQQDISKSSTDSTTISFDIQFGGASGISGGGFGVDVSGSEGSKAWVGEQSSIVSGGRMEVDIENHTQITGGVLGSLSGDMTLNTGTLGYEDIYDHDYYKEWGVGTGLHVGKNPTGKPQDPKGGIRLRGKYKGKEREQTTKATIGEGEINIGGQAATEEQLEGLNRDMDKTQEITRDEAIGGLDTTLEVDFAWIKDPLGQFRRIANSHKTIWTAAKGAYEVVGDTIVLTAKGIEHVANAIVDIFDGEDAIDKLPISDEQKKVIREAVKRKKEERRQDAMNMTDKVATAEYGDRAATTEAEVDKSIRKQAIDGMQPEELQKWEAAFKGEIDAAVNAAKEAKGGHAVFPEERDRIAREIIAANLPQSYVDQKGAQYLARYEKANNDMVRVGAEIEDKNRSLKAETDPAKIAQLNAEIDQLGEKLKSPLATITSGLSVVPTDPALAAQAQALNDKLNSPEVLGAFATSDMGERWNNIPPEQIDALIDRKAAAVGLNRENIRIVTESEFLASGYSANAAAVWDSLKGIIVINSNSVLAATNITSFNSTLNHEIQHALDQAIIDKYNAGTTLAERNKIYNSMPQAEKLVIGDYIISSVNHQSLQNVYKSSSFRTVGMTERASNIVGGWRK